MLDWSVYEGVAVVWWLWSRNQGVAGVAYQKAEAQVFKGRCGVIQVVVVASRSFQWWCVEKHYAKILSIYAVQCFAGTSTNINCSVIIEVNRICLAKPLVPITSRAHVY